MYQDAAKEMTNLFSIYASLMRRFPLAVQSTTCGILFVIGDCIAQHGIEKTDSHDILRTSKLALYGTLIAGPGVATWYRFMDSKLSFLVGRQKAAAMVCLDQLTFAPFFLSVFFLFNGFSNRHSISQIKSQFTDGNYANVLMSNYKVWPIIQAVNFAFTPLNYRLLVVNITAIGWNAYLSYSLARSSTSITHKASDHSLSN